eukprot:3887046-Amphidinium_carterae.2
MIGEGISNGTGSIEAIAVLLDCPVVDDGYGIPVEGGRNPLHDPGIEAAQDVYVVVCGHEKAVLPCRSVTQIQVWGTIE